MEVSLVMIAQSKIVKSANMIWEEGHLHWVLTSLQFLQANLFAVFAMRASD